jgi:hypothetical protein
MDGIRNTKESLVRADLLIMCCPARQAGGVHKIIVSTRTSTTGRPAVSPVEPAPRPVHRSLPGTSAFHSAGPTVRSDSPTKTGSSTSVHRGRYREQRRLIRPTGRHYRAPGRLDRRQGRSYRALDRPFQACIRQYRRPDLQRRLCCCCFLRRGVKEILPFKEEDIGVSEGCILMCSQLIWIQG